MEVIGRRLEIDGVITAIDNQKQLNDQIKLTTKALSEIPFGSKGYDTVNSKLTALKALKAENRREDRKMQQSAIATGKVTTSAYRKMSTQLIVSRNKLKDYLTQQAQGIKFTKIQEKEFKDLTVQVRRYDKALKKIDADAGQYQRNVGNYSGALAGFGRNILGAFGIVGGASLIGSSLKNIVSITKDFEQSNANLASILGKSKSETLELQKVQKRYGATTAFSATQVANLQTELAKLGFTTKDIVESTKGIIDFSVATGADVPRAAALAGAALRAFGLDASEMDRVVSTLAVSTTKSALDFSKLETGLSVVAPVARAFGFSIEETVALLGKLSDAGFDASSAATATRNILLNLANTNGALAQKLGGSVRSFDELIPSLVKLRDDGVDLNETLELTDKRSVAAFNQFLQAAEGANTLKDSITGVNDELKTMTEERLNTVEGSIKLAKSAWEGFILSIEDGSGILSTASKGLIDFGSDILTILTQLNEGGLSIEDVFVILYGSQEDQEIIISNLEKARAEQERIQKNQGRVSRGGGLSGLKDLFKEDENSIADLSKETSNLDKKTENLNNGSLASLKKKITDINKEIDGGNFNESVLSKKLNEIAEIEAKIIELETKRRRLERGDQEVAFIPSINALPQSLELDPEIEFEKNKAENIKEINRELDDHILEKKKENSQDIVEELEKQQEAYLANAEAIGGIIGTLLSGNENAAKDSLKQLGGFLLDQLEKQVLTSITGLKINGIYQAFLNPALAFKAAAQIAVVKGLFAAVKGRLLAAEGLTVSPDGIIQGKRHANGGEKFNYKGVPIEAEQGEFIDSNRNFLSIVNRNDTKKNKGFLNSIKKSKLPEHTKHEIYGLINSGMQFAERGIQIRAIAPRPSINPVIPGLENIGESVRVGALQGSQKGTNTGIKKATEQTRKLSDLENATSV